MPHQLSVVRIHGENRTDVEIVETLGFAKRLRPWRAIARADIDKVGFGIVGQTIPHGCATAVFPPLAGPRFGGLLERWIFKRLRRIARNSVEAPQFTTVLDVERGEETA